MTNRENLWRWGGAIVQLACVILTVYLCTTATKPFFGRYQPFIISVYWVILAFFLGTLHGKRPYVEALLQVCIQHIEFLHDVHAGLSLEDDTESREALQTAFDTAASKKALVPRL